MSSSESPSFFTISAAEFDGVTPLTALWQPNPSPRSQPRSYASPSLGPCGRISYAKLGQPGTMGQLVTARCQLDAASVTLQVRSENAVEAAARTPIPDSPAPNNLDVVLDTRNLTTVWCAPLLMGPTDAIALTGRSVGPIPATVDIITVDLQDTAALAYLNAIFASAAASPSTVNVRVVTASEVITPFAGTQYILGAAAGVSMALTLPLASDVVAGTTLIVTRVGGGWISVIPQGADTINGATTGVLLDDFGQVTLTLRNGQWLASESPITVDVTVTNAVDDASVAVPVVTGTTLVNVNFTARGGLQLPAIADVATGVEYMFQRTADSAGFSPARVVISTQAVGDTLNGVANGFAILGNPGSAIRLRRTGSGWLEVSDRQSTPTQTIITTADDTLDSGWAGSKLIRASKALTAQTLRLPAVGLLVVGTSFDIVYTSTISLTINGNGVNITGGGASGPTVILGPNESGRLSYNGTEWTFVRSLTTVRSVNEAANRVLTEVWNGLRIFRATQAAAQTLTLPAASAVPIGMEAHFVCLGAGGLTVNGGGTNIIGVGVSAPSKAIALNTNIHLISDGTNWLQTF